MKRQIMSYKFLTQSYTYCFIYRAEFHCIDHAFDTDYINQWSSYLEINGESVSDEIKSNLKKH